MTRQYLSNTINGNKIQTEWKIQLTMAIDFISSNNSDETRTKSDNIEIVLGNKTGEITEELFEDLFCKDIRKD